MAGVRGLPLGDLEALGRALTALSQAMMQFPQLQEVDLNPVRVFPGKPGLLALDARVRVGQARLWGIKEGPLIKGSVPPSK